MSNILTPQELAAIEAEVAKDVEKEAKAKERERVKGEMLTKARQARGIIEPDEMVYIDLPETGAEIKINMRSYQHQRQYTVPASVAIMLRDTMQRAWQHQAEIEGRTKNFYVKRQTHLGGNFEVRNMPASAGGVLKV